jgi:nucleolar MIF4G domain-containing protein 1
LTLQDLIDAETRGRWWRAGASWVGTNIKPSSHTDSFHQNQESSAVTSASKSSKHSQSNTNFTNSQETQLLKLAKKMNFHTSIRQQIFCVLMSSHDLQDAYERLERLELKEKSNREIIRVVIDCCGQEESFNLFYPELICYFCKYDRQNKITAQYAIWDNLKILTESSAEIPTRRIVNLVDLFLMNRLSNCVSFMIYY